MKKFMKAIAFVTVMCMALSTVAFAAGSVPETALDKTFQVTVTGAGNEQVALMVVAAGATNFNTPLYIDQKASENDNVAFEAVLTNTDVEAVDVYVGYASNQLENGKAPKIGTVKLVQPITKVTVSKIDCGWTDAIKGDQQYGTGVWAEFDVKVPDGVTATNMIWAIRYTENGEAKVKYSDPVADFADYNIGSVVKGSVTLGFAFLNGFDEIKSDDNDIDPVTITGVDAIFLFSNSEDEIFTNPADEKPEN